MIRYLTGLTALVLAAAFVAPATAADLTKAETVLCTLGEAGRCKDGTCQWRAASERMKSQQLKLEFASKKAIGVSPKRTRPLGMIVTDEMKDGKRMVVVARNEKQKPENYLRLSISADGTFEGSRRGGRLGFKGTCAAS